MQLTVDCGSVVVLVERLVSVIVVVEGSGVIVDVLWVLTMTVVVLTSDFVVEDVGTFSTDECPRLV